MRLILSLLLITNHKSVKANVDYTHADYSFACFGMLFYFSELTFLFIKLSMIEIDNFFQQLNHLNRFNRFEIDCISLI
jgi:hypothetical protein